MATTDAASNQLSRQRLRFQKVLVFRVLYFRLSQGYLTILHVCICMHVIPTQW